MKDLEHMRKNYKGKKELLRSHGKIFDIDEHSEIVTSVACDGQVVSKGYRD